MSDRSAPPPEFKAALAEALLDEIRLQGMNQSQAAEALGLPKSRVSEIANGRLQSISEQRLLEALATLGFCVQVSLRRRDPDASSTWTFERGGV